MFLRKPWFPGRGSHMVDVLLLMANSVLGYFVYMLWRERGGKTSSSDTMTGEMRALAAGMEEYRTGLEDLLNRIESRLAEERRSLETVVEEARTTRGGSPSPGGRDSVPSGPQEGDGSSFEKPPAATREMILALCRRGWSPPAIAQHVGRGVREVEMILAFSPQNELEGVDGRAG